MQWKSSFDQKYLHAYAKLFLLVTKLQYNFTVLLYYTIGLGVNIQGLPTIYSKNMFVNLSVGTSTYN